ncbi:MAG: SpoIVB peptidase S55 domain-containing protein [Candidatus Eisenbacteria bacterium]
MLQNHRSALAALVGLVLVAACAGAAEGPFVPIDELRPGDKCVARSVFSGTTVEEFDVVILGVVRGTDPASDLIIVRAENEFLERTGIPQGISGSPVYLDGRLVGAISATWGFTREPIAGVTPIGEMLPALERQGPSTSGRAVGALGLALVPPSERGQCRLASISTLAGIEVGDPASRTQPAVGVYGDRTLTPMSLPLVVSGGSESLLADVAGLLGGCGLTPVRGSSASSIEGAGELVPGSSMGVRFIGGDMNWTAIGTLTYRDGDRVVAFGHPVFEAGDVEMPMVGAYVHTVVPLASVSFKYASGTELVGTVHSDRRRAVGGVVGPAPETLPLEVTVRTGAGDATGYEFDVTRTRPFSSLFAGLATAAAISEAALSVGHSSVSLSITLATSRGPVSYESMFHTMEPALRAGGELAALMDVVMDSAFEDVDVTGASAEITLRQGDLVTSIERVAADRAVYEPGDPIELAVTLRDWQGGRRTESLVLRVPDDTSDGPAIVRVGGAAEFHEWDADRLSGGMTPRTWDQLRSLIESSRPGNTVVAQLLSERPGLSLSGRELARVPGKAALVMGSAPGSGAVVPAGLSVLSEDSLMAELPTGGFHEFQIFVRRSDQ